MQGPVSGTKVVPAADDGSQSSDARSDAPRALWRKAIGSVRDDLKGGIKKRSAQLLHVATSALRRRGTLSERLFSSFDYKTNEWAVMNTAIVHPNSRFAVAWNVLSTGFILLSVLYIPFELAFSYKTTFSGTTSQAIMHLLNPAMDLFFIIDIFVQFRIALLEDGELVQSPRHIAAHYLRTWFALDFVSSASSFIVYLTDAMGYKVLRNVRLLRLARLLKLVRMVKLRQLLSHLDMVRLEMRIVAKLFKLMVVVMCITHILSCGFYGVAVLYGGVTAGGTHEMDGSWLDVYYEQYVGLSENGSWLALGHPNYQSIERRYLVALYWAFITTTTVGYGDICPQTDEERGFVILSAFMGTAIFAYITGEVAALVNEKNHRQLEFDHKKRAIADYMAYYSFPAELRKRVRRFYEAGFESGAFIDESVVLSGLSLELRTDVSKHMKCAAVMRAPALRSLPPDAALELSANLRSRRLRAGAVMAEKGDEARSVFLLTKGEVDVVVAHAVLGTTRAARRRSVDAAEATGVGGTSYGLTDGSVFGYLTPGFTMIVGQHSNSPGGVPNREPPRLAWAVDLAANTDLEFYELSRPACDELCARYPELKAAMLDATAGLRKMFRVVGFLQKMHEAAKLTKSGTGNGGGDNSVSWAATGDSDDSMANFFSPSAPPKRILGPGGTPATDAFGQPELARSELLPKLLDGGDDGVAAAGIAKVTAGEAACSHSVAADTIGDDADAEMASLLAAVRSVVRDEVRSAVQGAVAELRETMRLECAAVQNNVAQVLAGVEPRSGAKQHQLQPQPQQATQLKRAQSFKMSKIIHA